MPQEGSREVPERKMICAGSPRWEWEGGREGRRGEEGRREEEDPNFRALGSLFRPRGLLVKVAKDVVRTVTPAGA